jgi:hypothetical protein
MTYTFKLSRRLARLRDAALVVAAVSTQSCTSDQSIGPNSATNDPTSVTVTPGSATLAPNQVLQFRAAVDSMGSSTMLSSSKNRGRGRRTIVGLALAPDTVTVAEGSISSFIATATLSDGTTTQPSLTWTATGGTVDVDGRFTAGSVAGSYAVKATASNGVADSAVVIVTDHPPAITSVSLSPTNASLAMGGSKQFVATGTSSTGSTVAVAAKYAATGGTVSTDGVYQAGQTPGTFRVVATDTLTNLSDTASVIIEAPAPTLQAVVLSPATVSLAAGAGQQFTATGSLSDGSTTAVTVTWTATGGSISSGGLYTAGQTSGTFRIIGTQSGGILADTATVTVTAPVAASPPPPTSGTTNFLATAESSGSFAPWNYAISDAQVGGGDLPPSSSSNRAKNGSRSWKFEIADPNGGSDGTTYAQFLASGPQSSMGSVNGGFKSGYYSFYAYVDAGYTGTEWNMLLGWMTGNGLRTGTHPISHMGLEVHNGVLQVVYVLKSCTKSYACPSIAGYSNGGSPWYLMTPSSPAGVVPFPRNQWVHLSIYYKMSATNGQVTIWQDGVKIMDITAPTMNTFGGFDNSLQNPAGDMILQFGSYGPRLATVQRLYVDDFQVSDYRPTP